MDKRRIFISSVFAESFGTAPWTFRRKLKEKLSRFSYQAWLYEDEITETNDTIDVIEQKITDAITSSDYVFVFFKSRAGGIFNDLVKGTVFEINEAKRLSKPLRLFIIGNEGSTAVKQILSVYNHFEIIECRINCTDEEDAIEQVLFEASKMRRTSPVPAKNDLILESDSKYYYEHLEQLIASRLVTHDYKGAFNILQLHHFPKNNALLSRDQMHFLGLCFSRIASLFVNMTQYPEAIDYSYKAIGVFLRSNELYEVYAEIERLSGILSMAGDKRASFVNLYGGRSTGRYIDLGIGYQDSRISIYSNLGMYDYGLQFINKELFLDRSAYYATRYFSLFGRSGKNGALQQARKKMEEELVPLALKSGELQAFVLSEAGRLAIEDYDIGSAKRLLNSALDHCKNSGALHTEKIVKALLSNISNRENK